MGKNVINDKILIYVNISHAAQQNSCGANELILVFIGAIYSKLSRSRRYFLSVIQADL
jgi:hypothetical protein